MAKKGRNEGRSSTRGGGSQQLDRRTFVTTTGLAALGVVAGCAPSSTGVVAGQTEPATSTAASVVARSSPPDLGALPGWAPLASLPAVSVAADRAADGYPSLSLGDAFDSHPAVKLLLAAVAGVSGTSPEDTIRSLVREGGTVVIKPNWVEPASWEKAKITHPTLVLAMARLAADVVGPSGRVIVAEGTSEGPDLPKILALTGFERALRPLTTGASAATRAPIQIVDLNNGAAGGVRVELDRLSRFSTNDLEMYDGHGKSMGRIGDGRVGTYLVGRPILQADLVIDMAKAKVHSSAGITLALKNLVGIVPSNDGPYGDNSLKDIPHYSAGDAEAGRKLAGNQTIGSSAADLHAAVRYLARDGSLQRSPQRNILCIIDGVVCGQRSQFEPDPAPRGWIVAGPDPVAVDHAAARCMGFDPGKVSSLKPAAAGSLVVGNADPAKVRMRYAGPGGFCGYFSSRTALEPEQVRTDWSGRMSLERFDVQASASVAAGRLLVRAPAGAVVRVHAAGSAARLGDSGGGRYSIQLPPQALPDARVVVTDQHFNMTDQALRG